MLHLKKGGKSPNYPINYSVSTNYPPKPETQKFCTLDY